MDAKVDVGNILPGDHPALENAAYWLRQHFDVPENETIFNEFEQYFDCRIIVQDRNDSWMQPDKVVFENSRNLTAFVLKWS